ncbi:MAG: hypothetical protein ACFFC7_00080 [Candidatus Hermodarchaeota archaeon]
MNPSYERWFSQIPVQETIGFSQWRNASLHPSGAVAAPEYSTIHRPAAGPGNICTRRLDRDDDLGGLS